MVAGVVYSCPSAIFFMVPRRILPERVFGRPFTTSAVRKQVNAPIVVRTRSTSSAAMSASARVDAGFQNHETERHFSFQLVSRADHRALGHVRMPREHFLDSAVENRCPATLMMSSTLLIT